MGFCSAYGCANLSTTPGNSFFRFPLENKVVLKQWIANIKRKNFKPTKSSQICQLHFEKECFEPSSSAEFLSSIGFTGNRLPKLKPNAVPTIFSYTESKTPGTCKRPSTEKRRRKEVVNELLGETNEGYEIRDTTNCYEKNEQHTLEIRSPFNPSDKIGHEPKFVNAACQTETLMYTKFKTQGTQTTGNRKFKTSYTQTNVVKTLRKCIQTEDKATSTVKTQ